MVAMNSMLNCVNCIGPLAGALTNNFGCRVMAIVGTLVATVGLIATIFAPNIWFMYVSFGIVVGKLFHWLMTVLNCFLILHADIKLEHCTN